MFLLNLAATGGDAPKTNPIYTVVMIGLMVVAVYFFTIRPQQKKQKEERETRGNIQIGDEITTIGGIVGRVAVINEETIVIETGAERVRLRIVRGAVGTNNTQQEKLQAEREAAQKAAESARAEKIAQKKDKK